MQTLRSCCSFRNGPRDVESLLDAIEDLLAKLEYLSAILQDPLVFLPAECHIALEDSLKSCKRDLTGFQAKLEKCEPSPHDGRMQRLFSRLRPVVQQKEFQKVRMTINIHASSFSTKCGTVNLHRTTTLGQMMNRNFQQCIALQNRHFARIANMETSTNLVAQANIGSLQLIGARMDGLPDLFTQQMGDLRRQMDFNHQLLMSSLAANKAKCLLEEAAMLKAPNSSNQLQRKSHEEYNQLHSSDRLKSQLKGLVFERFRELLGLMYDCVKLHGGHTRLLGEVVHMARCADQVIFKSSNDAECPGEEFNPGTSYRKAVQIQSCYADVQIFTSCYCTREPVEFERDPCVLSIQAMAHIKMNVHGRILGVSGRFSKDVFEDRTVQMHPILWIPGAGPEDLSCRGSSSAQHPRVEEEDD